MGYDKEPRGDGNYWANVLHKVNLKLGGANHSLELGLTDMPEKTMVVGIDVAHPAPGSMENAPSVVAMVASMNENCVHFPGSVRIQESKQEIQKLRRDKMERKLEGPPDGKEDMVDSSNITALLEDRLRLYYGKNEKNLPENILIYRDGNFIALHCRFKLTRFPVLGVSESQYQAVLDLELKPIQGFCEKFYREQTSAPPPKITIIIVGKRHHTRFYPTKEAHADEKNQLRNPLNGTVVDRGITMHKGWDFYLQAHSAIKGTVSIVIMVVKKCPDKNVGQTGALRSDSRRHWPSGSSGGNDHPQSLVLVSKGHQSGLLLHASILRGFAMRTGPRLAHESRAAQGSGDKVRL